MAGRDARIGAAKTGAVKAGAKDNVLRFRVERRPFAKRSLVRPGIAWRLTDEQDNVQECDIQPPSPSPRSAWTVAIWLNGAKLFTRTCGDAAEADFVANALLEDQLLGGAIPVGRLRHFKRR